MWNAMKKLYRKTTGNERQTVSVTMHFTDQDVKAIRLATGREVDEYVLEELIYSSVEDDLAVMYRMLEESGLYFSEDQYHRAKYGEEAP